MPFGVPGVHEIICIEWPHGLHTSKSAVLRHLRSLTSMESFACIGRMVSKFHQVMLCGIRVHYQHGVICT